MCNGPEKELIASVFCQVLEIFSFTFCEVADKDETTLLLPGETMQADISFTGHSSGQISLLLPVSLSLELLANTLGKDEIPLNSDKEADVVKELLNITCGNILDEVYGRETIFNISSPKIHFPPLSVWDDFKKVPESIFFKSDKSVICLLCNIGWRERTVK